MSWTRFDDNWSSKMEALGLNAEEVGYLVHLIQYCSRTNTYDGRISAFKARTVTEVHDPDAILAHLAEVGRVKWDDGMCVVLHLDHHLPPPSMREDSRKEAERDRKRRQRSHARGDHSLCDDPTFCPGDVPPGHSVDKATGEIRPGDVPVGPGTGRAGPGLEELPEVPERTDRAIPVPPPLEPALAHALVTVPHQGRLHGWDACPACGSVDPCDCD